MTLPLTNPAIPPAASQSVWQTLEVSYYDSYKHGRSCIHQRSYRHSGLSIFHIFGRPTSTRRAMRAGMSSSNSGKQLAVERSTKRPSNKPGYRECWAWGGDGYLDSCFPYSEPHPEIPNQLSYHDHLPLRPSERRDMPIMQGGTIISSRDRIGRNFLTVPAELAPEDGVPDPWDRRARVIGRLTLTCRDSLGLNWSFVYDLDWTDHWISINTGSLVQKDLRGLDVNKGIRSDSRHAPPAT